MKVVVSCINFFRANGLKHRQFQAILSELEPAHGNMLYHTEVRWFSRGRVLKHFYKLLPEINAFLLTKGKTVPELINTEWKWDLAFLTDVTEISNGLNVQLQGKGKLICDMYSHVKSFEVKLALLVGQVQKQDFTHLPATRSLSAEKCKDTLETLRVEFSVRFHELHAYVNEMCIFQNPFAADINDTLPSLQFELAELQTCNVLKDTFNPNCLIEYYTSLPNETYPTIKKHAMKMSTFFGSTYIGEQNFSHMKLIKNLIRSRLSDQHLHQSLRLAVTGMEPDINLLSLLISITMNMKNVSIVMLFL